MVLPTSYRDWLKFQAIGLSLLLSIEILVGAVTTRHNQSSERASGFKKTALKLRSTLWKPFVRKVLGINALEPPIHPSVKIKKNAIRIKTKRQDREKSPFVKACPGCTLRYGTKKNDWLCSKGRLLEFGKMQRQLPLRSDRKQRRRQLRGRKEKKKPENDGYFRRRISGARRY